ncbi:glycosyltransferase [Aestuariirhabdus litorea]|uniref:Glycosyltransferase n=1 Tax=Aestuariirhabdus litorea TaxID=2528527 RepID=A0A3P3VJ24_9GAMM|nr:glycosyltransferase [Aestuariirhabdus litorea]RRJ82354.1 glycosyltransferase [Aestuariirhabdus litorea]RWW92518.1 glycosyltransferase [Endozoicomonadaceae bacterium GTF-13]
MSKKIRVLQLQARYNVNSSDLAEQVIRALPPEQYEVTSAYLKGKPGPGEMETSAPRVKYFEFSSKETKGLRLGAMKQLANFCREQQFDVVIAHRFKPIHMLMVLNRKLRFRLCIGVAHGFGDYDRLYRKLECRWLIRDNWKIVGVSEPVRRYLVQAKAGFTEANTVAINNAIDIEAAVAGLMPRAAARDQLGLPADALLFGAIGRLVPVKGHSYLIDAFAEIAPRYPHAQLAIIGGGRLEAELRSRVESLGLASRIHLLGTIENAFRFARAFDLFVLPSLSEGLPLALLEGMSASLPVISSDIPTLKPIVERVGVVVPVGDVPALAEAMASWAELPESERKALGERHFSYLQKNHSIHDFRRQYRTLIEQGLAGE